MGEHSARGRHAAPTPKPRHRAADPVPAVDSPLNTGPLRVVPDSVRSKKIRFFAAAGAAGLAVAGANVAAGSGRATAPKREPLPVTSVMPTITAQNVPLSYASPSVVTIAAPPVDDHSQAAPEPVRTPAVASEEAAPVVVPAPVPVAPVQTPAPPPGSTALGDRIAAAALAQLGVTQDCTMLVTNALAAVGIQHHGWPVSYFALGYTVNARDARPGDLIYYANGGMGFAHIAVYIGNDMAVHGGWNGNSTVTFSAYVGSGPVFIRIP